MARVLSAVVLLPVVVGAVWFFPLAGTLTLALIAGQLAAAEYRVMARALGFAVSGALSGTGVAAASVAVLYPAIPRNPMAGVVGLAPPVFLPQDFLFVALFALFIVVGASAVAGGAPGPPVLGAAAATLFPAVYIGMPLGALAAISADWSSAGREALILLIAVIVVSDSAQYYTGRAFGRRPLAPLVSPKKTIEGAVGGLLFGTLAMVFGGRLVFSSPVWALGLAGVAITILGMLGDLFESLLKRSANIKDSSGLIPGHGGILDRIDSWLFAAPAYYLFTHWLLVRG